MLLLWNFWSLSIFSSSYRFFRWLLAQESIRENSRLCNLLVRVGVHQNLLLMSSKHIWISLSLVVEPDRLRTWHLSKLASSLLLRADVQTPIFPRQRPWLRVVEFLGRCLSPRVSHSGLGRSPDMAITLRNRQLVVKINGVLCILILLPLKVLLDRNVDRWSVWVLYLGYMVAKRIFRRWGNDWRVLVVDTEDIVLFKILLVSLAEDWEVIIHNLRKKSF